MYIRYVTFVLIVVPPPLSCIRMEEESVTLTIQLCSRLVSGKSRGEVINI